MMTRIRRRRHVYLYRLFLKIPFLNFKIKFAQLPLKICPLPLQKQQPPSLSPPPPLLCISHHFICQSLIFNPVSLFLIFFKPYSLCLSLSLSLYLSTRLRRRNCKKIATEISISEEKEGREIY